MANISDSIETIATGPLSVTVDGATVVGRSLADVIKADAYLRGVTAAGNRLRGMRLSKILPAGPQSDQGGTLNDVEQWP